MVDFILTLNPGVLIVLIIVIFISLVSQIALYAKAGQPGLAALVPVWNVIVFVELVGRPKKHALWIIIPGIVFLAVFAIFFTEFDGLFPVEHIYEDANGKEIVEWLPGPSTWAHMAIPLSILGAALIPMLVFICLIFTEICDSFGKHKLSDKIYCIIFNAAYLLVVIGVSQNTFYEGPWYAKKNNIPYTMPELKGKTQRESKSEVLEAIAAKYKKKK